jgi:tetratricopeptide (TPR) repeat protein
MITKHKIHPGLLILLSLLFFLSPPGLMADDDLSEADTLYDQGGMKNYKRSIELYLKALELAPDSYETQWKCARAYRRYGREAKRQKLEGWKEICASYGKEGMKYAQNAMELKPNRPEGFYYYGLCVGIYSDGVSIFTALAEGLKNKTQNGFEKAYEMDKMYDEAGPILALGRFWAVVPWPFKNKKKALKFYREYQKTPYFAEKDEGKIYLAELLLDLRGKENKAEAKALLEEVAQSDEMYFRDWAKRLLLGLAQK